MTNPIQSRSDGDVLPSWTRETAGRKKTRTDEQSAADGRTDVNDQHANVVCAERQGGIAVCPSQPLNLNTTSRKQPHTE